MKEDDMVGARITLMKRNADGKLKKKRQDVSVPETVSGSPKKGGDQAGTKKNKT